MSHPDARDRALAHGILDAARDGERISDDLIEWALEVTGNAKRNPESRGFAVFVATVPGTLQ